jgi:hypothetical protein
MRTSRRIPRFLTLVVALIAAALMIFAGIQLLQPPLPLIVSADFEAPLITPNADGDADLTTFSYTLSRNAVVSLTLSDSEGMTFTFRDQERRVADDYRVLFSGVVDGYVLPEEVIHSEVERRLIPDGNYTWTLVAVGEDGEQAESSGTLNVSDADSQLPDISGFSISPTLFTPNRDGLSDRVNIHAYVDKAARLTMFLVDETGQREYITERGEGRRFGEAGSHVFDYDGGIDAGQAPPPDGEYQVVAIAEDAEGQRVRRMGVLAIRDGGYPVGAIFPQPTGTTVFYDSAPFEERYRTEYENQGDIIAVPEGVESIIADSEVVLQGDMLVFRVTVTNDGSVGLRTTGPVPGTVYEQDQRSSGIGWTDESGAWRVGLECETAKSSYPWRWAIAPMDQLEVVEDGGETYYYLPPGEQAVVWGGVRLTEILSRNPQQCWIGLIHEDVAVVQSSVDRRWVEIQPAPDADD